MYTKPECLNEQQTYKNVASASPLIVFINTINEVARLQKRLELETMDNGSRPFIGRVFVLETGIPIMENFNKRLLQFMEVGLMSKWKAYSSTLPAISYKEPTDINVEQSTTLKHTIIFLLMFGYLLGLIGFVGKIIRHYFSHERKENMIDLQNLRKQKFHLTKRGRAKNL